MATEDASSPFDSRSRQPPRRRSAGGSESGASRRRRAAMAAASAGVDSLCSGQSVDLSRKALLGWMNSLLQLDLHELVECRDGDVFCQLLDIVFPQSVQLERVRWEPKTQQHRLHNMRLLQQALTRLNIKRDVPMLDIVEGHMKANLELAQWMKMLFRMHYKGEPYNARDRRQRCKREQKRRLRESGGGMIDVTHHIPTHARDGRRRRRGSNAVQRSMTSPLSSPPLLQTEAPCTLVCGSPYEFGACINGSLDTARFLAPSAMAWAHRQHLLYVAEFASHTIRCIDLDAGRVHTVAGLAGEYGKHDGEFEAARFACPTGLALSSDEDSLHVSDAGSHDIRTLDLRRGVVSTQHSGTNLTNPLAVLSGCALASGADACHGAEVGEVDECIVFSDLQAIYVRWSSQRHRRHCRHPELDLETRNDVNNDCHVDEIEFVCEADKAVGLAWLEMGRIVVAAESGRHRIVSIDLESGKKTVLAGSGVAGHKDGASSTARLNRPQSVLCVRHSSNVQPAHAFSSSSSSSSSSTAFDMYFTDLSPSVRRVVNERVETLVSTNLEFPCALAVLGHDIFFLDSACNSLYKIALERVSEIEVSSMDARATNDLVSELRRIAANDNAAAVFSAATIVSILLQRDVATRLETARGMLLDASLPRRLACMCEAGPNMMSERAFGCVLEQVQSCGWGGELVGLKLKRALRAFLSLVADSRSAMERAPSTSAQAQLQPHPDRRSSRR